jgi:hypothetical protein
MCCQIGKDLRAKLERSELEASVATQNYRFTGLPRYKQTLAKSQSESVKARRKLEKHCQHCSSCNLEIVQPAGVYTSKTSA